MVVLLAGASAVGSYNVSPVQHAQLPSQPRVRALRCSETSPFEGDAASPKPPAAAAAAAAATLPFTVENVDKTLDEVRPYLISDGGNVKVVGVDPETFGVELQLQGACGSCPSCACGTNHLHFLPRQSPAPQTRVLCASIFLWHLQTTLLSQSADTRWLSGSHNSQRR